MRIAQPVRKDQLLRVPDQFREMGLAGVRPSRIDFRVFRDFAVRNCFFENVGIVKTRKKKTGDQLPHWVGSEPMANHWRGLFVTVLCALACCGGMAQGTVGADLSTTNQNLIQSFWNAVERSNGPVCDRVGVFWIARPDGGALVGLRVDRQVFIEPSATFSWLSWPTVPNLIYDLQSSTNLQSWTVLESFVGNGQFQTYSNQISAGRNIFFRLQLKDK
jgi:hypothetical protein